MLRKLGGSSLLWDPVHHLSFPPDAPFGTWLRGDTKKLEEQGVNKQHGYFQALDRAFD